MRILLFSSLLFSVLAAGAEVIDSLSFGISPAGSFAAKDVARMLAAAKGKEKPVTIRFAPGVYRIGENQCVKRDWYISNHDQGVVRTVFLPLEKMDDVTIDASGAAFELAGRFIFAGVWDSERVTLKGGSIDLVTPPLTQIRLLDVNPKAQTVDFLPEGNTRCTLRGEKLIFSGPGFEYQPLFGILFEADGSIAYRTSDCQMSFDRVEKLGKGVYRAKGISNPVFRPFQRFALRSREIARPAPGIVLSDAKDLSLRDITIYYSDGMGVLAQNTENITLDGIRVIPNRAKGRYFSTQADATHFSGCWGVIRSVNGEYVAMMDDAINVHGTYLKVMRRVDDRTLEAAYMHGQAYGMEWGEAGNKIGFVSSDTLDTLPTRGELVSVKALDKPSIRAGAKRLLLTFKKPIPKEVDPAKAPYGLENLSHMPEVIFEGNRVANNRARGALFSSPRKTICRGNVFERVSGSAILLCGDCRGWFESGACKDITISQNVFIDVLSSPFQFTDGVISISPVIAKPQQQKRPFHSGVVIEDNDFVAFDSALVFAESVDGLTIRNNRLTKTTTYVPYHWNKEWLTLKRCRNVKAEKPVLAGARNP